MFDFTRHATWELKATKAALSKLPLLNSADDNARLQAIKRLRQKGFKFDKPLQLIGL